MSIVPQVIDALGRWGVTNSELCGRRETVEERTHAAVFGDREDEIDHPLLPTGVLQRTREDGLITGVAAQRLDRGACLLVAAPEVPGGVVASVTWSKSVAKLMFHAFAVAPPVADFTYSAFEAKPLGGLTPL
ncbi:MAG TPA: hypothetical protein VIJ21_02195 [Solirubrobacterales bacterium]